MHQPKENSDKRSPRKKEKLGEIKLLKPAGTGGWAAAPNPRLPLRTRRRPGTSVAAAAGRGTGGGAEEEEDGGEEGGLGGGLRRRYVEEEEEGGRRRRVLGSQGRRSLRWEEGGGRDRMCSACFKKCEKEEENTLKGHMAELTQAVKVLLLLLLLLGGRTTCVVAAAAGPGGGGGGARGRRGPDVVGVGDGSSEN